MPLLLLRVDPALGAVMAPIVGEIERISLDDPADVWSGGRIVAGGDNVVIPRNLLIDLPANRLTLQQLFAQAPPACLANGETGLAKADRCNIDATGGLATIFANRTNGGNVIAGDVRIAKAVEIVTGVVTYISYTDGYFRLNGIPGKRDGGDGAGERPVGAPHDPARAGVRARQHGELQRGRAVRDRLHELHLRVRDGVPAVHPERGERGERGNGCGRPVLPVDEPPGAPVAGRDAVRARRPRGQPVGDRQLRAGGGRAVPLRAHGEGVRRHNDAEPATQPDYMIFNEVGWDAPPYPASRVLARFLGATSLHDSRVDIYSVHYDNANVPHEIPLETTVNNPGNGAVVFLGVPTGAFETVLNWTSVPIRAASIRVRT